jgi:hypothetical protein
VRSSSRSSKKSILIGFFRIKAKPTCRTKRSNAGSKPTQSHRPTGGVPPYDLNSSPTLEPRLLGLLLAGGFWGNNVTRVSISNLPLYRAPEKFLN